MQSNLSFFNNKFISICINMLFQKGLLTDEKGNVKKLRPGEVLEVRQKRKSSTDMRRARFVTFNCLKNDPQSLF